MVSEGRKASAWIRRKRVCVSGTQEKRGMDTSQKNARIWNVRKEGNGYVAKECAYLERKKRGEWIRRRQIGVSGT